MPEPLEIAGGVRNGAELRILPVKDTYSLSRGHTVRVCLAGDGFEAERALTFEEATELRDWLNAALEAQRLAPSQTQARVA